MTDHEEPPVSAYWLFLIYTIPPDPSRLRAAVWRDVKRAGAVYLRDGVCVLPEHPRTLALLKAIAAKIDAFGGEATLIQGAQMERQRAEQVKAQMQDARAAEYAEVEREAQRFLEHVQRESEHRAFTFLELQELEADLGKLRRWTEQIEDREYFHSAHRERVGRLLECCEAALAAFEEEAAAQPEGSL